MHQYIFNEVNIHYKETKQSNKTSINQLPNCEQCAGLAIMSLKYGIMAEIDRKIYNINFDLLIKVLL